MPVRLTYVLPPLSLMLFGCLGLFGGKEKDAIPSIDSDDLSGELRVTDQTPATFTVIATHPEGDDAVVSGEIQREDGSVLSTFTRVDGPRWYAELDWAAVNAAQPLTFEATTSLDVFFVFKSQWDVSAVELGTIVIHCEDGKSACDRQCVSLADDPDNCGACGNACPACVDGGCAELTDCKNAAAYVDQSLDDVCVDQGYARCVPAPYDGEVDVIGIAAFDRSCNKDVIVITDGLEDIHCSTNVPWADGVYIQAMCAP